MDWPWISPKCPHAKVCFRVGHFGEIQGQLPAKDLYIAAQFEDLVSMRCRETRCQEWEAYQLSSAGRRCICRCGDLCARALTRWSGFLAQIQWRGSTWTSCRMTGSCRRNQERWWRGAIGRVWTPTFARPPSFSSAVFGAGVLGGVLGISGSAVLEPRGRSRLTDWLRLASISWWSRLCSASRSCSDLSRSSRLPAAALTERRRRGESLSSRFLTDGAASALEEDGAARGSRVLVTDCSNIPMFFKQ